MPVIQTNYRADKYVLHITRLIDKNIDACKKLFPESIRFDYIKTLFVVSKYERKGVLTKEYEKFKNHRKVLHSEHIQQLRVTDRKSLVDMRMAVGVTEAYLTENIDSFILCSSDSDFWGLISSIPTAILISTKDFLSEIGRAHV